MQILLLFASADEKPFLNLQNHLTFREMTNYGRIRTNTRDKYKKMFRLNGSLGGLFRTSKVQKSLEIYSSTQKVSKKYFSRLKSASRNRSKHNVF